VPVSECFHVRVLIPCYTEALEIVRPTLLAVANATLPKARAPRAPLQWLPLPGLVSCVGGRLCLSGGGGAWGHGGARVHLHAYPPDPESLRYMHVVPASPQHEHATRIGLLHASLCCVAPCAAASAR